MAVCSFMESVEEEYPRREKVLAFVKELREEKAEAGRARDKILNIMMESKI